MITIEVDKAVSELKSTLGRVKPELMNDLIAKSLNAAMTKARRAAYDEVNRVYNIRTISDVTSKVRGEKAKPGKLTATLFADRRGIQLAYFQPSQETSGKRQISIEVRRGQRKQLKSAFWATANSGAGNELQSIFARGQYQGRSFAFRTKRLVAYPAPDTPIGLLRTTSPLDMLSDKAVQERINTSANETFNKSFEARLRRILAKGDVGGE